MNIDMDKILDVLGQGEPDVITIGGAKYTLKRLAIADVASFDTLFQPRPGETAEQMFERILDSVRDLFEGASPPFLARVENRSADDLKDVGRKARVLIGIIGELIAASSGNEVARARAETKNQISEARASIGSD